MVKPFVSALVAALACASTAAAQDFKLDSADAIRKSAGVLAKDLMAYYNTKAKGFIPGLLPDDVYYWYETGIFMNTFINYWQLTGDSSYNDVVREGMLHQRGEQENFMVSNQTASTGNEDQCTWALAAMSAAEYGFPSPPDGDASWARIAQNVFEQQTLRIDNQTCTPGGLRWQIFAFNNGYDYQDAISNACYFNLGARLARYTGNSSYSNAAANTWTWLVESGVLETKDWDLWSGLNVHDPDECDEVTEQRLSHAYGLLAHGAAVLQEQTDDKQWRERLNGLVDAMLDHFFKKGVAFEEICEQDHLCNTDQIAYRGQMLRALGAVTLFAPDTAKKITPVLEKSAEAAVGQCTGGESGRQCGFYWAEGEFVEPETSSGVGEQMNALAVVSNLLLEDAEKPRKEGEGSSNSGGGGSSGDKDEDKADGEKSSGTEGDGTKPAETPDPDSAAGRTAMGSVSAAVMTLGLLAAALLA